MTTKNAIKSDYLLKYKIFTEHSKKGYIVSFWLVLQNLIPHNNQNRIVSFVLNIIKK